MMAEIPKDLLAKATALLDAACFHQYPDGTLSEDAYEVVAKAILAERQRCAAIARKYRNETSSLMSMPPQSAASAAIERYILSGEPA